MEAACHGDTRLITKSMSQNTSIFRHLQPLMQVALGLLPSMTEKDPDNRSTFAMVEPYMDSLHTRRPLPRSMRARRVQSFMQMSIDA